MKKKEFLTEIKKLSPAELETKKRSIAEEIFKLRLRKAAGQLEQGHRIRELRKDLARVSTLLNATAN